MLCIENAKTNELLKLFPLSSQEVFYVEFLHSVNRTLVREYYILVNDQLMLSRAEYTSFGAGMPEVSEHEGATLSFSDGVLRLDDINRIMPEFIYRVGTLANHTLFIGNREIPFKFIAPPQTGLRFTHHPVSAYTLIRRFDDIER